MINQGGILSHYHLLPPINRGVIIFDFITDIITKFDIYITLKIKGLTRHNRINYYRDYYGNIAVIIITKLLRNMIRVLSGDFRVH